MPTRDIPRDQWRKFCDDFSRQHRGRPATIEVLGDAVGAQEEVHKQPFEGISADEKDGENRIEVMIGSRPANHMTHIINHPSHLRVEEQERGKPREVLQIEAEGQPTTLVEFD